MSQITPLEDILFVFNSWTLMVKSGICEDLIPGAEVDLLNRDKEKIGVASIHKYLSSRNPEISAIEIGVKTEIGNMKDVKFVKRY